MLVVVSGGFDPLHSGHLDHINKAKELGGELLVIVQNEENLIKKKGFYFMSSKERINIIGNLVAVDKVILNIDDDMSSIKTLEKIRKFHPNRKIVFAKGGDRFSHEIPESEICKELDIEIMDGVGGHLNSSSGLVRRIVNLHKKMEKVNES